MHVLMGMITLSSVDAVEVFFQMGVAAGFASAVAVFWVIGVEAVR
ncbi:MAG: hypothetical protein RL015_1977, partial [Verrucomicrobiota bacterium]